MTAPLQTTRAAAYIRVSQVGGRTGEAFLSPDLQRERIHAWAAYRQAQIVETYTDLDVSGRTGTVRPAFERMMRDAAAGRFDCVCVYRLTRFGRSVKDTATRYAELRDLGIGLVSVTEDIDTTTASGKLMQNMLFAMAEFESERIGEEWRAVHANRRARGLHHASRGVYGYETTGAVPTHIRESEAQAIRSLFARRAAGDSFHELRRWLFTAGHQPRSGESHFDVSTIRWILANPLYAGLIEVDGELRESTSPAIVSRAVWEQVRALRGTHAPPRHTAGLLAGLLHCESCDYRMVAGTARGYRSYRCQARILQRDCPAPAAISMPRIDEWAQAQLLAQLDPRRVRRPRGDQGRRARLAERQRRAQDVQRALDQLADERYLFGSLDTAEYERQARRLLAERAAAQRDVDALRAALTPIAAPAAYTHQDFAALPLRARQRVLRLAILRITVSAAGRNAGRAGVPPAQRCHITWR